MERNIQKFTKVLPDLAKVKKYYSLMLTLNDMHLGKGELQFLVWVAGTRGTFSEKKKSFIGQYSKKAGVVDNMIGKLRKLGLLMGAEINPYAFPDFSKPIIIQITLNGEAV